MYNYLSWTLRDKSYQDSSQSPCLGFVTIALSEIRHNHSHHKTRIRHDDCVWNSSQSLCLGFVTMALSGIRHNRPCLGFVTIAMSGIRLNHRFWDSSQSPCLGFVTITLWQIHGIASLQGLIRPHKALKGLTARPEDIDFLPGDSPMPKYSLRALADAINQAL